MKRQAALQSVQTARARLASSHSRSISRLPCYSGVGHVAQAAAAVITCHAECTAMQWSVARAASRGMHCSD